MRFFLIKKIIDIHSRSFYCIGCDACIYINCYSFDTIFCSIYKAHGSARWGARHRVETKSVRVESRLLCTEH